MDQTLYDLLLQDARFLYGAETEQEVQLRALAESLSDERLQAVFREHAQETAMQISRLETILKDAGEEPQGKVPSAVSGLIADAELVAGKAAGPVRDVAIAAAARKMEHYEIGCYETAVAIAEQLGIAEVLNPLQETLQEERRADMRLAEAALVLVQTQVPLETEPIAAGEQGD
ncbi:MAG TPA: DUF892 family protein [Bryobacteraceae bacterium]|nr:DUF892 family protein [Bryobacteraceae bacterium]